MTPPFDTVLVGLGAIGLGDGDPLTARHYRDTCHADVLSRHPAFRLVAAVDPDEGARARARERGVADLIVPSTSVLAERGVRADVLVAATPPGARMEALAHPLGARRLLIEKPLGMTLDEVEALDARCREIGAAVQVNLWRRCDAGCRDLAGGGLVARIGEPRGIFGVYGNGLVNNGTHLIDLIRMLCGEPAVATVLGPRLDTRGRLPLAGDVDRSFALTLSSGIVAAVQALDFRHYREVGLEIWGTEGRLAVHNEGLSVTLRRRGAHRAITGSREIDAETFTVEPPTAGGALRAVYDNLAAAALGREALFSDLDNARATATWVDTLRRADLAEGP